MPPDPQLAPELESRECDDGHSPPHADESADQAVASVEPPVPTTQLPTLPLKPSLSDELLDEVLAVVYRFLTVRELGRLACVSRRFTDTTARLRQRALAEAIEEDRCHIVIRICNLACPRCGQVFIDFGESFALVCSREGCGCGFCPFCLTDCGRDAHAHLMTCPHNPIPGSYGGSETEIFERSQRARRHRDVSEYLLTLNVTRRRGCCTAVSVGL